MTGRLPHEWRPGMDCCVHCDEEPNGECPARLRAALDAAERGLEGAARVHCACGGHFTRDGAWFVHAERCSRGGERSEE